MRLDQHVKSGALILQVIFGWLRYRYIAAIYAATLISFLNQALSFNLVQALVVSQAALVVTPSPDVGWMISIEFNTQYAERVQVSDRSPLLSTFEGQIKEGGQIEPKGDLQSWKGRNEHRNKATGTDGKLEHHQI